LRCLGLFPTSHRRSVGRVVIVAPESAVVTHEVHLSTAPSIMDPGAVLVKAEGEKGNPPLILSLPH
jgi:hypothetical protein